MISSYYFYLFDWSIQVVYAHFFLQFYRALVLVFTFVSITFSGHLSISTSYLLEYPETLESARKQYILLLYVYA